MLLKSFWIAHSKAQLAGNGGPLAKSCYAALSHPGASRRASHHKHAILVIVDIRFLARLKAQSTRNTTLVIKKSLSILLNGIFEHKSVFAKYQSMSVSR